MKRKGIFTVITALALWLSVFTAITQAETTPDRPFLHPLFSDHAVLQRGMKVPVWGWTQPGEEVTVSFAGQTKKAKADADGKWMVRLDSMKASASPQVLSVTSASHQASINDILVGDVWLCSGQSNMEMGMGADNATNDMASADFPTIRLLTIAKLATNEPMQVVPCHWLPCSPDTIKQGNWNGFSAVGFFFGRELHKDLNVPIGLIHSSWGGTVAEAWTSREALEPLGDFKDRLEAAKIPPAPKPGPARFNPNITTVLFNGMISPLLPFAIKGAIWYQGESNADRAYQYRKLLPAMIADWRARFGEGDFPFYIVQLAAYKATNAEPRENDWAELREAQALTARTVGNSGLAVTIDIGDAKDIHPKDKVDVGKRLALCALANAYGKKVEFSGPWYKSMKKTDKGIRIAFDHVDGGLIAKGGDLKGFAIAGEDHKFVWADAVVDGKTVLVSSPNVAKPVAVRYAWDSNPVCNLFNEAGLPAVPFRTDDWPMSTQNRK